MFSHEVFQQPFQLSLLLWCQLITRINLRVGRIHSGNLRIYGRWNISCFQKFSCHGSAGQCLLLLLLQSCLGWCYFADNTLLLFRFMNFDFIYVVSHKYLDR
jgi:hypothetical protein